MQSNTLFPIFFSILISLFGINSVQAATYAISFFDTNNDQVGQGRFTTNPAGSICVEGAKYGTTGVLGDCATAKMPDASGKTQYDHGYVVDRKNPVTELEITVQDEVYDGKSGGVGGFEDDVKLWWNAEGQSTGYYFLHRYGPITQDNRWSLGEFGSGSRQFVMSFGAATATSASGTWLQSAGSLFGEGSFTVSEVSQVPIPAAFWLFASGLVFLAGWRKKKHGSRLEWAICPPFASPIVPRGHEKHVPTYTVARLH